MFDNLFILVGPFASAGILFVALVGVAGTFSIAKRTDLRNPRGT